MAALLGNFLLPEGELQDLYKKLGLTKGENVRLYFYNNFIVNENEFYIK